MVDNINPNAHTIKAGWVLKRKKTADDYQKKWLVLDPNTLTLFNEQHRLDRVVEIAACRSVQSPDSDEFDDNSFIVYTHSGSYLLIANDAESRQIWIELIGLAIRRKFPDLNPDSILKEGWAVKRSRHLKKWRPRLLQITPTNLYTLKDQHGQITESLDLQEVTIEHSGARVDGHPFSFSLTQQGVTFYIAAYNKKDMEIWIGLIRLMKYNLS